MPIGERAGRVAWYAGDAAFLVAVLAIIAGIVAMHSFGSGQQSGIAVKAVQAAATADHAPCDDHCTGHDPGDRPSHPAATVCLAIVASCGIALARLTATGRNTDWSEILARVRSTRLQLKQVRLTAPSPNVLCVLRT